MLKKRIIMAFACLIAIMSCSGSTTAPPSSSELPSLGEDVGSPSADHSPGTLPALPGEWAPEDFNYIYDVGPGYAYATPSDVPWEDLDPATLVRIHWRSEPYRDKWVMTTRASEDAPLVVLGVPDNGRRPVISGENAHTRPELYYLNESRSVIKIGNYTGSSDNDRPAHVIVENLDIKSARPEYNFINRYGSTTSFSENAASVHIEEGDRITIRNCKIHDSGNGLFTSHLTSDILISGNHIYDNGILGRVYEHNTYTESLGIVYEYNFFGPLRTGCGGNNLKDRSAGTVIRYNWIQGGNRQLDLVETDYESFFNDPRYDQTFVYGNILFEDTDDGNSQMIHYGGDGDTQDYYRRGILYLYHNTIVSNRTSNTTLIRLSTDDVTADIRNNIIYTSATPGHLALTNGQGILSLHNNWLTDGYRNSFEATSAVIQSASGNLTGTLPGFTDADAADFALTPGTDCIGGAGPLPSETTAYPVRMQYVVHQSGEERPDFGSTADIGAFELF